MNLSTKGRKGTRISPASGSATQMAEIMNEETSDSSEKDVKSDDVLPTQSLLIAAVTKRVLQVLSKKDKECHKRRKRQKKRQESKRQRVLNTPGTNFESNEKKSDNSDILSSSSKSDSVHISDRCMIKKQNLV